MVCLIVTYQLCLDFKKTYTYAPHPLLVPWSRKGRAIPLLPLWTVRPVQSLSVCTRVHFTFTFILTLWNMFYRVPIIYLSYPWN